MIAVAEYQTAYISLVLDQVLEPGCSLMCAQMYGRNGDVTAKVGACSDLIFWQDWTCIHGIPFDSL